MAGPRLPGEFELIARYFAPLAHAPGALGLRDDAALVDVDPGRHLVATTDALVEGVHFLPSDPADRIGRKALRVNLSDLAAKGARPLGYLLTLALSPRVNADWVERLAAGLAADQATYGVSLLGGDTAATPGPTMLSVAALGSVGAGRFLPRGGAADGDRVMVSGTLGDGALGLKALRGGLEHLSGDQRRELIDRYQLPLPRLSLGAALAEEGIASASIDVSDGLVADLGHVAETSGLGARIEAARVPLSPGARTALAADPGLWTDILAGGDDYELLFTAAPGKAAAVAALAERLGLPLTDIGRMKPGPGVRVFAPDGAPMRLAVPGYRHF